MDKEPTTPTTDNLIGEKTDRILVEGVGWIPVKNAKVIGFWVKFFDPTYSNKVTWIRKDKVIGVK